MEQLMTPDGLYAIWDTQRDFSDLCRKYISDDAGEYIYQVIGDCDKEQAMAQLQFDSDYKVMERELEYWNNELWELKSQLEQLSVQADEPGFSKKKVVAEIDKMWQHLQKIL